MVCTKISHSLIFRRMILLCWDESGALSVSGHDCLLTDANVRFVDNCSMYRRLGVDQQTLSKFVALTPCSDEILTLGYVDIENFWRSYVGFYRDGWQFGYFVKCDDVRLCSMREFSPRRGSFTPVDPAFVLLCLRNASIGSQFLSVVSSMYVDEALSAKSLESSGILEAAQFGSVLVKKEYRGLLA